VEGYSINRNTVPLYKRSLLFIREIHNKPIKYDMLWRCDTFNLLYK